MYVVERVGRAMSREDADLVADPELVQDGDRLIGVGEVGATAEHDADAHGHSRHPQAMAAAMSERQTAPVKRTLLDAGVGAFARLGDRRPRVP